MTPFGAGGSSRVSEMTPVLGKSGLRAASGQSVTSAHRDGYVRKQPVLHNSDTLTLNGLTDAYTYESIHDSLNVLNFG